MMIIYKVKEWLAPLINKIGRDPNSRLSARLVLCAKAELKLRYAYTKDVY